MYFQQENKDSVLMSCGGGLLVYYDVLLRVPHTCTGVAVPAGTGGGAGEGDPAGERAGATARGGGEGAQGERAQGKARHPGG